jgi:hypothetical protein
MRIKSTAFPAMFGTWPTLFYPPLPRISMFSRPYNEVGGWKSFQNLSRKETRPFIGAPVEMLLLLWASAK